MSIRTRFNERVSEMSSGEAATYATGAFGGEIGGMLLAGTVVLDSINDKSVYQPLQDRVVVLHNRNEQIRGVTDSDVLKGYSGKTATEAFLNHEAAANMAKIKAVQARQPEQISSGAAVGIFVGMGLAGVVVGTAVAHGTRKTVSAARSRFKKTESTAS